MPEGKLVAVSGGTGFVGRATILALLAHGYRVRAFSRKFSPKLLFPGNELELVMGDLFARDVQEKLLSGADTILHIAGATKAFNAAGFFRTNTELTGSLLETAKYAAPNARWVQISSLAARDRNLSPYAASKRKAEELVQHYWPEKKWVILRPPAVYGPGDMELLPLFKAAKMGFLPLPMPKNGRVAMIHVGDLASVIVNILVEQNYVTPYIIEVSDDQNHGYTPADLHLAFETALDRNLRLFFIPEIILRSAAFANHIIAWKAASPPMLLPHKLAELRHSDWAIDPSLAYKNNSGKPRITLSEGLRTTFDWYRQNIRNF